ncbi:hypothetical protein LZ318_25930 [Saccharopolyspora indica]|uniref:hypothetical protein n=1 Tax=Saccharopolyspora indica TaxID=1229659 RepID=UPI0022EA6DE8|nr:hypothetical protein [Saccharopolyspora indica]MDA3646648.1 hypothetical protein [Saccharopolyspora indica]
MADLFCVQPGCSQARRSSPGGRCAMISAGMVLVVAGFGFAMWWVARHFIEYGKHAGSGEGALTVSHLLAQAAREAETAGRHRLREPGPPGRGLDGAETDQLPRVEMSPPAFGSSSRDPLMMQRILTALHQI